MNVIGKECPDDCEADLSAAFAQVIAAIVDGCLDGAERREAISEVMRVHQRVLRTSDHVICMPGALGHIGGQLGRDLSGH
jgi:hypothetical protein